MIDDPALLHRAAERLREHVGVLRLCDVRGPWSVHSGPSGYPQSVNNVGAPIHVADTFTDPKAPPAMANYIALMHPGVGAALADWLEHFAVTQYDPEASIRETDRSHEMAFTVARQILGEDTL